MNTDILKYGKWTVLKENVKRDKHGDGFHLCECECGLIKEVRATHLRLGNSAGCQTCTNSMHGYARRGKKHDLYKIWEGMRSRCNSPNSTSYHRYGGRGITICERWKEFPNFLEDMGPKPHKDMQLDRIDPDGNYEPNNCRWATRKENSGNRRCSPKNRDLYKTIKVDKLCNNCKLLK